MSLSGKEFWFRRFCAHALESCVFSDYLPKACCVVPVLVMMPTQRETVRGRCEVIACASDMTESLLRKKEIRLKLWRSWRASLHLNKSYLNYLSLIDQVHEPMKVKNVDNKLLLWSSTTDAELLSMVVPAYIYKKRNGSSYLLDIEMELDLRLIKQKT